MSLMAFRLQTGSDIQSGLYRHGYNYQFKGASGCCMHIEYTYIFLYTHTAWAPTHSKTSRIVVGHFGDRKWEIDFAYPEARINATGKCI